jgi:uncharacterized protein
VRCLPPRVLGASVGGLILITNTKTIAEAAALDAHTIAALYLTLAGIWTASITHAVRYVRRATA